MFYGYTERECFDGCVDTCGGSGVLKQYNLNIQCGQPRMERNCTVCGAPIGGTRKLKTGNVDTKA